MSAGRLENIPDDANFVCCDVKSPLARDVVKNGHFDAIVHLAAQTMVPASMEDPKKDMEDNIEGTVNILEAARKYGVKRIIFSSSAAVYGDIAPECLPVRETEPLRPVSFYGLSKMTCENYIRLYQKAYGLSYVIFRFANVYGERQGNGGEGGVVSVFARQLAEGKSPAIYGNGQQTRDFIYAGDIANGIRKALFSETANITCNLSTGREVTVKDAADRLLRPACQSRSAMPRQEKEISSARHCAARWRENISAGHRKRIGRKDWNEPIFILKKNIEENGTLCRL